MPSLDLPLTASPDLSATLPRASTWRAKLPAAVTGGSTFVTAVGVDLLATAAFGRHHQAMLVPGAILTGLGAAAGLGAQLAAPRDVRVQLTLLCGWLAAQAGVAMAQVGDSHYAAATDHITRSHSTFLGGVALAAAGLALLLPALQRQLAGGTRGGIGRRDLVSVGLALAVGGAAVTGFAAGSAANVAAARPAGLVAVVLGLSLAVVGQAG